MNHFRLKIMLPTGILAEAAGAAGDIHLFLGNDMDIGQNRISTGVPGLDEILQGGLRRNHVHLIRGMPGSGKTTFAMQFLLEGVRHGEKTLYITLLQARREVDAIAASHGWDSSAVEVSSLTAAAESDARISEQTLLPIAEVQLGDVMNAIKKEIDRVKSVRLAFDSLDQLRLLAGDSTVYRRQVLALQRLLEDSETTAVFTDPSMENNNAFGTLAHGVITLDTVVPSFGEMRRRLCVEKMRGVAFAGGFHSFRIRTGGIEAYPRLPLAGKPVQQDWNVAASGIEELDNLFGGGLEFGTACLLSGDTGTGKSSVATAYACAAAKRGQHAVIFLFDERTDTFLRRSEGIAMKAAEFMKQGLLTVHEVNVGDLSGGEMAHLLRKAIKEEDAKVVVIDSLTGYYAALSDEPRLLAQLHEMLSYLGQQQVLSLIVLAEHAGQSIGLDASYIADSVMLLRRFEAFGSTRTAVSVLKKRHGNHERAIRELKITSQGIVVGQLLREFQGVLTGEPTFVGEQRELME